MSEKDDYLATLFNLFPGPFVMLTACLDESKNGPIFCVSGVLFNRVSLKHFDREWKRELKHAGVRYYHAVDCAHGRGEFAGKTNAFRMDMHRRMCEIMNARVLGSLTVVSLPWYFPFKKADWGTYSEYTACALLCMNGMFDVAKRLDLKPNLAFFIEDGNSKAGELRTLIRSCVSAGVDKLVRCNFTDKRGLRGVQAADVFAYECCKRLHEKSKEPDKPTEKAMRKSLATITRSEGRHHRFILIDQDSRRDFKALIG